jgi:hypothetical protein
MLGMLYMQVAATTLEKSARKASIRDRGGFGLRWHTRCEKRFAKPRNIMKTILSLAAIGLFAIAGTGCIHVEHDDDEPTTTRTTTVGTPAVSSTTTTTY